MTSAPASAPPPGAGGIQQFAEVAADRGHPPVGGEIGASRRLVDERHPGQRPAPPPATPSEPAASSCRARRDPTNPAPPVITTFATPSPVPARLRRSDNGDRTCPAPRWPAVKAFVKRYLVQMLADAAR